jgi:energy-converting hydrogenase Eha subunit G
MINQPREFPMTDFDQNKNSDAEHKAAIRKSLVGWALFIAGTLMFFAAADAVLMP